MTKTMLIPMLCGIVAFTGCAKQPDAIQAAYVSPAIYSSRSCAAIVEERNRVVQQVNTVSAAQKKKASNDAVATGVGLVLFWPALFALNAGADNEAQLASLKGNYDALTAAGVEKGCLQATGA